jgi:N12 class adenine-specific DNA methylase
MTKTSAAPDQMSLDALFLTAVTGRALAIVPTMAVVRPMPLAPVTITETRPALLVAPTAPTIGTLVLDADGTMRRIALDGSAVECGVAAVHRKRVVQLIALRDAVRTLLHADLANAPEVELSAQRTALTAQYETFVATYGPINQETVRPSGHVSYPNLAGFIEDPGYPLVAALEVVARDEDGKAVAFTKATIFTASVVRPNTTPDVQSPRDALAVSLNALGRVDIEYIAVLCRQSVTAVLDALREAVFYNPLAGRYETADEFLSGAVVDKHAAIVALHATTPRYAEQIAALAAVLPAPLTMADIAVSLGAPWIPEGVIAAFCDYLLGIAGSVTVTHTAEAAQWRVNANREQTKAAQVRNTRTWGTERASALHLVELSLNQKDVRLTQRLADGSVVLDATATENAREKQIAISEACATWIWSDTARTTELVAIYNARYNVFVARQFDGAHLTLPGVATDFTFRAHQKNAVWRALVQGNAILGHDMGSGKSAVFSAIAMESRRLGLAKKPCIVTPLSVVHELAREFQRVYPLARLLVGNREDVTKDEAARFVAQIATGDYDAVVLSQEHFARLALTPENERALFERQMAPFVQAWDEDPARGAAQARHAYERNRTALVNRRTIAGVSFEETGIDLVLYDEAHLAKNLAIPTKVLGLGTRTSARARDLFMKAWFLAGRTPGRGTVLGTGTVISNSFFEAFVFMYMLMPERLRASGFLAVDAWLANFAKKEAVLEHAPAGGFRVATRFVGFQNVPELMALFSHILDVVDEDMLAIPRPALATGGIIPIAVAASPELAAYNTTIAQRAERTRGRGRVRRGQRGGDSILQIMNDWTKAAVDLRCAVPDAVESAPNKLDAVAERVLFHYRETMAVRGTQLIFSDVGTPNGAVFNVYDALRAKLIAGGIAPEEIAFVHDATRPAHRTRLFRMVRDGAVRVLFGSTEKLGVGVNIQARAIAVHTVSAFWRGSDLMQCIARVRRQGNMHDTVFAYAYLAEGTSDAYKLQAIERKMRVARQVLRGKHTARTIEDVDAVVVNIATLKALATGDPRIVERHEVDLALTRAERQSRQFDAERHSAASALGALPSREAALTKELAALTTDCANVTSTEGTAFAVQMRDGRTMTDRKEFGEIVSATLEQLYQQVMISGRPHQAVFGTLGGLTLVAERRAYSVPAELIARGAGEYAVEVARRDGLGAIGFTRRAEHLVATLVDRKAETERALANLDTERAELTRIVTAKNPATAQIVRLTAKLERLNTALGIGAATVAEQMADERAAEAEVDTPRRGRARAA